uniref:Seven TM Receptor n=1 Tax=Caenorhabditis tropicalis TaxID=1561998 RepID=A0A1I7V0A3_9PELO
MYSTLEIFLVPIHYTVRTTSVVMVHVSDKLLPLLPLRILNSVYWAFFGSSLAIFALQFIYRYLTISMNKMIKTFYSWKIVLWLLIPIVNGIIWGLMGICLCRPTKESTEYLRPYVLKDFKTDIDEFDYLGGLMYLKLNDGSFKFYFNTLLTITVMSVIVSFSFVVIIFCGSKCYLMISEMNAITSSSACSQKLQSQLFYALVFQTLIPVLLLHFPISVMFGFVLTDHGLGIYSSIVSITISLYPAIDPLPNFFIISPYRKAAFRCIKRVHPMTDNSINQAPPNSKNVAAPAINNTV